ncbi:MAG: helix-turn-helix transcriptional regulator [Streptosporangiales bacterium]
MKNVGHESSSVTAAGGTRDRVFRLVLELGRATAAELAQELRLTPAAVRRHLDALVEVGYVADREAPCYGQRGRGRPARVFVVTDAGRDAAYQGYDDLAASALRYLGESVGPEAIAMFARKRVAELERRYRQHLDQAPSSRHAAVLAEALTDDGYAASVVPAPVAGGGAQLCQHHCPVAHVAAEFPQLCEAEAEAFARLLGTQVQRLATIARGDDVCTTHVSSRTGRGISPAADRSSASRTTTTFRRTSA